MKSKYESLEDYAKTNNKEYLLFEFSPNNVKSTKEIPKSSKKLFKWNCFRCKSEYDMSVSNRVYLKTNCPYCSGHRVNKTNCLWSTCPEVASLLKNETDGYKVTKSSQKSVDFKCNKCGNTQSKIVQSVTKSGFSCSFCSDGKSYPEKFTMNVLSQLRVKFETEKTFIWSENKRYDFYIPSLKTIIETHGGQHFIGGFGRTYEEEVDNDKIKRKLAKLNNITNYIEIDCSISKLKNMKNNIHNSGLNEMFDLSKIDWIECEEFAISNLCKKICDSWNDPNTNIEKIIKDFHVSRNTIYKYLKRGDELNWCNYTPKKLNKNIVQISIKNEFIKEWESIISASVNLNIKQNHIPSVLNGKMETAGGYKWMYKEDYDKLMKAN